MECVVARSVRDLIAGGFYLPQCAKGIHTTVEHSSVQCSTVWLVGEA